MKFGWALLVVMAGLIPVLIGLGFGWDALLQYCSSDDGCKDDEVCSNHACIYACNGKNCPKGAMCLAKHHTFACVCHIGYGIRSKDTMKICRKMCNYDPQCEQSEICDQGFCVDACDGHTCDGNATSLALNHKCTCECLPGFTAHPKKKCVRLPICSDDRDCYYSEECIEKKCVAVCRNRVCPQNEVCIAYNHTSVCSVLSEVFRDPSNFVEKYESRVASPLAHDILTSVLAFSTYGETKIAISGTFYLDAGHFNLRRLKDDPAHMSVHSAVSSLQDIGAEIRLYVKADPVLKVCSAADRFGILVGTGYLKSPKKLRLINSINFNIEIERLQTECTEVDNESKTVNFIGTFATGDLIGTDFAFCVIPYEASLSRTLDVNIVFLYKKSSGYGFNTTIVRKLSQLKPNAFFLDTNVKKRMEIIVPNNIHSFTETNVGETLLQHDLNIKTAKFATDGMEHIDYQPNEYEIFQTVVLDMTPMLLPECTKPAAIQAIDTRFLNTTGFAMFIVTGNLTFFQAFLP